MKLSRAEMRTKKIIGVGGLIGIRLQYLVRRGTKLFRPGKTVCTC
jgi:hypothetical protein